MSGGGKAGLDPDRKAALESWLTGQAGARSVTVIDEGRLSGGAISLNLAVTLEIDGGPQSGRHPCVLRTGSASGVSASLGKAEEAAVLCAVFSAGATVPEPLFVGADPAMLGAPFYIMRRATGVAAGFRIVKSEEPRRELARELGRQLGLIHRVRPGTEGLEFLARPEPTAALQAVEDFRRWAGRYAASDPVLAYGLRWLERNAPPPGDLVLCHRDYRTGNYMVDGDRLTAIIDWEFAGWSDPMEDLGWFCAACWRFGRNDREAGGIADRADLYAGYEETAGRRVDPVAVAYWEAAACMRWAVIAIQQADRHISGTEPSLELALTGRMLPEIEMDLLRHLDAVEAAP
ncbi:phosphotransferase family protein [Azospirillum melinis]|uniref:phosphotransferase family protein n=1 Tax=Azospirillum melinis TaxID=328839 RepID=UPI0037569C06